MTRRTLGAAMLAVLLLVGCGGEAAGDDPKTTDPKTSAVFNTTDVMFLQMMLAHHEPGARLLSLAGTKSERADIKALADGIERAQAATSATISGWLTDWGLPLTSGADAAGHAAHGGLPLIDDAQLAELATLTGPAFDTAFLNVLIGHQHAAVELARMETGGGVNPQARDLAQQTDATLRTQLPQLLRLVAG